MCSNINTDNIIVTTYSRKTSFQWCFYIRCPKVHFLNEPFYVWDSKEKAVRFSLTMIDTSLKLLIKGCLITYLKEKSNFTCSWSQFRTVFWRCYFWCLFRYLVSEVSFHQYILRKRQQWFAGSLKIIWMLINRVSQVSLWG